MRQPALFLAQLFTLLSGLAATAAEQDQQLAAQALRASVPRVQIALDVKLGVARHIASADGFLTGPAGVGKAVARAAVAGEDRALRGFLDSWPALFGGGAEILTDAEIIRDDVTAHSGLRTRVWRQMLDGIPVHHGVLVARTTAREELVALGSGFAPRLPQAAAKLAERANARGTPRATPAHSAIEALAAALRARGLGVDGIALIDQAADPVQTQRLRANAALGEVTSHLTWHVSADELNLAWSFTVVEKPQGLMFEILVDCTTLAVLERIRLTADYVATPERLRAAIAEGARAQVSGKSGGCICHPAGGHGATASTPGGPTGNALASLIALGVYAGDSPLTVSRTLETLQYVDATASPDGWIGGTNDTRGNNVDARLDLNGNNTVAVPRPQGTGTSPVTFNPPINLADAPAQYGNASVVNLFYWCNVVHDRLYQLGFTESAGNFQNNNFGRGGSGNDAVIADAQDGLSLNDPDFLDNANFSTPADGSAPRMQMYVFTSTTPNRDSSLDATVVIHEYVHGLTNRLVGGGATGSLNTIQSAGMGEGWSDFYALALLSKPTDDPLDTYAVGSYVTGNLFRGIRSHPYAVEPAAVVVSTSLNPKTFSDIIGVPFVHDIGEVWCQALWECRGELMTKHGAAAGNTLMLELVTDGLKLTPASPTFTQARDAILQADLVKTGGANHIELWRAFAKRGLGFGASAGADSSGTAVTESFETSQRLRVSNAAGVVVTGEPGGPFTVNGSFTVYNPGTTTVGWTASSNRPWYSLSATSGNLTGGTSTNVTVNPTASANPLPEGTFLDTITFTDTGTGVTVARPIRLIIRANYTVAAETFAWVDPAAHTLVTLNDPGFDDDDDALSAAMALPFTFSFYGVDRSSILISSNGMIGFGDDAGLTSPLNAALPLSGAPNDMLAVWWDDLNPADAGTVRMGTVGSPPNRRTVVSWVGVPHFSTLDLANTYTFQAVLEEATGDLVVQYQEVRPSQSTFGAGRSATIGVESGDGLVARQYSHNGSTLLANAVALRFHRATSIAPTNASPTVVPPGVNLGILNSAGTARSVSVLGNDDNGEANLVYTWSFAGSPTSIFTFSANGSNGAKSSVVTFTKAGTFPIRATITDAAGASVTSTVNATVPQQLSSLGVSPATTSIANGTTVDFTALGFDQFGDAITGEPTVTWSILSSGPGSITSTGLYTASGQGAVTIQAASGALTPATATITVTNGAPTVATPAAASPSPVTGTTTTLTVLGADDGGEAALTYTWSTTGTPPAAVTFSANGSNTAKSSVATFIKAGTYVLRATISDASAATVTSDITVTVQQTTAAPAMAINPSSATVAPGVTQAFTAHDADQFGEPIIATTRPVTWTAVGGTIASTGTFTAPASAGTATVTATATVGGQTDTATVTIAAGGGGGDGGGGGGGGGCGLGTASTLTFLLLMLSLRRRRLGD